MLEKRGTSGCCRWLSSLQRRCYFDVSFVSLWNLQPKTPWLQLLRNIFGPLRRHSSASVWHCSVVRQKPSRNEQKKSPDLVCLDMPCIPCMLSCNIMITMCWYSSQMPSRLRHEASQRIEMTRHCSTTRIFQGYVLCSFLACLAV